MDIIDIQVQNFLQFSDSKRKQHVKELDIAMEDFKESNVFAGEVYNTEDVENLMGELKEAILATADKELENAYNTAALTAHQLLLQGKQNGCNLVINVSQLENESLLGCLVSPSSVRSREAGPVGGSLSPQASLPRAHPQHLPALGQLQGPVEDSRASNKDKMEQEIGSLKEKLKKIQLESTAVLRDRTALRGELESLKEQIQRKDEEIEAMSQMCETKASERKETSDFGVNEVQVGLEKELEALRIKLEEIAGENRNLEKELGDAKEEIKVKGLEMRRTEEHLAAKLTSSKQFASLKLMMQKKSQEVVKLKRSLAKYEPQEVANADLEETPGSLTASEFEF